MTVRAETPYIEYYGNGVATDFTFTWSSGDANDNYVILNGVIQIEGTTYELEEYTPEYGGIMRFTEPLETTDRIIIYRDTPVTQEVDYEEGKPFPAETHERQMDKDTRILQEIIEAGKSLGGVVDLEADQQPTYVDILNSSGTDARIEPWTTDGLLSGVSMGEVIPDGGTLPQDTAPTDKPNGYIWWGLGPYAVPGGDSNITMFTTGITVESIRAAPDVPRAEFMYDASAGLVGYGYDKALPLEVPAWMEQPAFAVAVAAPNTYVVKFELLTATSPSGSATGTWLDAAYDANWFTASGEVNGIFHIAPDLGGQTPDPTAQISRYVTLIAQVT